MERCEIARCDRSLFGGKGVAIHGGLRERRNGNARDHVFRQDAPDGEGERRVLRRNMRWRISNRLLNRPERGRSTHIVVISCQVRLRIRSTGAPTLRAR